MEVAARAAWRVVTPRLVHALWAAALLLPAAPVLPSEKVDWAVSYERAFGIFYSDPFVKSLGEKNARRGLDTGTGLLSGPTSKEPRYVFFFDTFRCAPTATSNCRQDGTVRKLLCIDAKTGGLFGEDRGCALPQRDAGPPRRPSRSVRRVDCGASFTADLEAAWKGVDSRSFGPGNEFRDAVEERKHIFLKGLGCAAPEQRALSARIIADLARRPVSGPVKVSEAIPGLLGLLTDEAYAVRCQAAEALGLVAEKGAAPVLAALTDLLKDEENVVRNAALRSLSLLGDATFTLVYMSLLSDTAVNEQAVAALGRLADKRAVDPLISLYSAPGMSYLQPGIIRALGAIRDVSAVPFLAGLLGERYQAGPGLAPPFHPPWPYAGFDAAEALAAIGEPAMEALTAGLRSSDRLTRLYSCHALSLKGLRPGRDSLAAALAVEKDPLVRTYLERTIARVEGRGYAPRSLQWIRVSIEPAADRFRAGEPVRFTWSAKNVGPEPVIINAVGVKVVQPAFFVKPLEGQSTGHGVDIDWDPRPGPQDLVEIAPGKTCRRGPFDLSRYFDLLASGPYEVRGVYENRFPGIEHAAYAVEGSATSDAATIRLR